MMKKEQILKIEIYKIESEYNIKPIDIFNDEDKRVIKILKILNDEKIIKPLDKRIFCLYMELGSLRKVGKVMGLSYENIRSNIQQTKNKILLNGNF